LSYAIRTARAAGVPVASPLQQLAGEPAGAGGPRSPCRGRARRRTPSTDPGLRRQDRRSSPRSGYRSGIRPRPVDRVWRSGLTLRSR
jgi:hypothetical protein